MHTVVTWEASLYSCTVNLVLAIEENFAQPNNTDTQDVDLWVKVGLRTGARGRIYSNQLKGSLNGIF